MYDQNNFCMTLHCWIKYGTCGISHDANGSEVLTLIYECNRCGKRVPANEHTNPHDHLFAKYMGLNEDCDVELTRIVIET